MSQLLRVKQNVKTSITGQSCVVKEFLGGGGQGEVYKAEIYGKPIALKWYFKKWATQHQKANLEMLINKGAPNRNFLWPVELAEDPKIEGFGYVMELRESRFHGIDQLMKQRINPSFRSLTTAGLNTADSFFQLHSKGLCYRDINFGNIFFDPNSGDIRICDNDNVSADNVPLDIEVGTPRFMAPEVVRNEAKPNSDSDLYSLATLLFYMFMIHHPLDGKEELKIKCLDGPAMIRLYGTNPIFIFDPHNKLNEPDSFYHRNAIVYWAIYPQFFKDLFIKSFTDGIKDPKHGRVRVSEWRSELSRLRDSIFYCECGMENFYDAQKKLGSVVRPVPCWNCNKIPTLPPRLRVGNSVIMLNKNAEIFSHHINNQGIYEFSNPLGKVVQNPKNPDFWGIQNLSKDIWKITPKDGAEKSVEPGRSLTINDETKITFGLTEGIIKCV